MKDLHLKFKNPKLDRESEKFYIIFNLLLRGEDPCKIIEDLLIENQELFKKFLEYTQRDTRPIEVNGQIYEIKYPDEVLKKLRKDDESIDT